MSQVTITVSFTAEQMPPDTPEVSLVRVKIMNGETVVAMAQEPVANPLVVNFGEVAPGNYTLHAQSMNEVGSPIGNPLEQPYTVPAERLVPTSFA